MQVYKAWSVVTGNTARVCQPDEAPAASPVTTAPVVIQVRPRRPRPKHPVAPRPAPPPPPRPPRIIDQPCALRLPGHDTLAQADAADLAHWLDAAVTISLTRHDMGTEGLATLLAARLDARLARALQRCRDDGRLGDVVTAALRRTRLEARPDCPLERILRSALRRYELRPWLR